MCLTLGLLVYVTVALLNYSLVQSVVSSYASSRFSEAWGGKVRIASMGCNPFNHLVLRGVELINPSGDTICTASRIAVRFDGFPIDNEGLHLSYVSLNDTYYHLRIDSTGLNLRYIIDYYKTDKPKKKGSDFKVLVDELEMNGVRYRQDLRQSAKHVTDSVGVDIPHMEWREIEAKIRNIRVDRSYVTCQIDRFKTRERSGLEVRQLRTNVYVAPTGISATHLTLETADSRIIGDVLLDYRDWKTMKYYVDSVFMLCRFEEGSYGSMRDAGYWAHKLWDIDEMAEFSGVVSGPVQDLHVEKFHVRYRNASHFVMDGYIYGLPGMDTTVIGVDVHNMNLVYEDLRAATWPQVMGKVATWVKPLGYVQGEASFTGTLHDFISSLQLETDAGDLKGDIVMSMDPKKDDYHYVGELKSDGFSIGRMVHNEWVSHSGLELSFEGRGLNPKTMKASAEGRLKHTTLRGQRLSGEAEFSLDASDGEMRADFNLEDALATVSAHGGITWQNEGQRYNASVDVAKVDLKRLGLWNNATDSSAFVKGRIEGRYSTSDERYFGRVSIDGVRLKTTTRDVSLDHAVVTAREMHRWKNLTLQSDIVNAQLRGYFDYACLVEAVRKFIDDYVPSSLTGRDPESLSDYESIASAQFEMDAEWLDTGGVLQAFVPWLEVARGTTLQANYNFMESLKPLVRSDSIRLGGFTFHNVGINGEPMGDRYRLRLSSDAIETGSIRLSEQSDLTVESSRRKADCRISWSNGEQGGAGDINLRVMSDSLLTRLLVDPSYIIVGGTTWQLRADDGEIYYSDGKYRVDGLQMVSDSQTLALRAVRMGRGDDEVELQLRDFGLEVINPYLASKSLSVGGKADGMMNLGGLNEVPYLNADMRVDGLVFNEESLGDARIRSTWNAEMNQLNLHVGTTRLNPSEAGATLSYPLELTGYVTMGSDDGEMHFVAAVEDVDLSVATPFVRSFSSKTDGKVNADLEIGGTLKNPKVVGNLYVEDGSVHVDFLNVTYRLNDTIVLDTGAIWLEDLHIVDERGGEAIVDGVVRHKGLKEMACDIALKSDRFLCLNTQPTGSEVYYGTVVAEVTGEVTGRVENLQIELNAKTLDGSSLHIPVTDEKQVQSASYIHFGEWGGDQAAWSMADENEERRMGIGERGTAERDRKGTEGYPGVEKKNRWRLTINVETTPDMELMIPMRSSLIDADIKTTGDGDLQLSVSSERPFSILGDYVLDRGTMMLNVLGLMSSEFSIDEGSSITFPGAVGDAVFDIKAVHSQRVNMSTLTGSLSATESQKQILVENVIALSGTLRQPDVDFDIRLPNADQSVQEEVFAYIDRTNERDMLEQTVSLLLFKRFYNSSSTASATANSSMASEGYGLVANSLGNVVSGMVQFVDVNFAYKAGNALTTDQYAVDISKEWNKFYFETTLGFGGEAREMSNVNNNNNMTGDMLVGYKINPRLHLFVFNRSNTNDYTRSDLPYKQGVGLKYTRDFDNLGELFRRKNKQQTTLDQ